MLCSAGGALMAALWMWFVRGKKPDPSMMLNGMLAGLVAITAPCAFVTSWAAVVIGLIAGILVVESAFFLERKLKIDDPVGAIAVHGFNGAWGVLSLGLFADGTYGDGWNGVAGTVKGLFYGDPSQFLAEVIGVLANFVWYAVISLVVFSIAGFLLKGNRVSAATEMQGLDIPEMGVPGYSGVKMDKQSETMLSR